jgi:NAD(P)-dependent dehydrogenase (short-subunit alcohol dehydrogenase family)
LITGASGLLGRALVAEFAAAGFLVLAQYRRHAGEEGEGVRWLRGDFAAPRGTAAFLRRHRRPLEACRHVVHNYGPIEERPTAGLTGADLAAAFQAHLRPALDITRFLLRRAALRSALFIAFEDTGLERPFLKVLPFAMAKNGLLLLGLSLAAAHPGVRFNVFSPPTLAGAEIRHPQARPAAPEAVAARIRLIVQGRASGRHFRWTAPQRRRRQGDRHE